MNRDEQLHKWRPKIKLKIEDDKSEIEHFMHSVLRPVLKFQNEVILLLIQTAPHFSRLTWIQDSEEENRIAVNDFIQKNTVLKNQLLGTVLGMMKTFEIAFYLEHEKELKKRIIEMCVTRFHSQHKKTVSI